LLPGVSKSCRESAGIAAALLTPPLRGSPINVSTTKGLQVASDTYDQALAQSRELRTEEAQPAAPVSVRLPVDLWEWLRARGGARLLRALALVHREEEERRARLLALAEGER
jgi:hypothetical protein